MKQMLFTASDPNFKQKISASFARQQFMHFIGAQLVAVEPGYCEIHLPFHQDLAQQHAYFHGGVVGTIADNSAGYAAYSLMPVNTSILTVEYKLNLLAPGDGSLLIGRGQVIKPGRTLTVSKADVFVVKAGVEKLCATSLVTLMAMVGKADKPAA
ncbi:MAG: PaaI family thioesterase [Chloroflexi bacterium]|nr:PaaI family thioesterase [Chloroflexota bacterium]